MGCGCESCERSYRDPHEVNFPEPVYVINTFSRINLTKVTSEFDGQNSAIQIRFSPAIFKEDFHSHWSDERGEHYTNTYNQRKAEVVKVETVREYEVASTSNSRCEQYLAVHSNDCRLKCSNSSCVDYNTTKDFADYLPKRKVSKSWKGSPVGLPISSGWGDEVSVQRPVSFLGCQYQVCYQRNCMYFGTAHAGLCRCGYQYCIYRGNSHIIAAVA